MGKKVEFSIPESHRLTSAFTELKDAEASLPYSSLLEALKGFHFRCGGKLAKDFLSTRWGFPFLGRKTNPKRKKKTLSADLY